MDYMALQQLMQLVKIEERDHWVAMVLSMVVGIPQKNPNQEVGLARASVSEAVVDR